MKQWPRLVTTVLLGSVTLACSHVEKEKAELAVATWRNRQPARYTYVLQPTGPDNPGQAVRLEVDQDEVLEAMQADGNHARDGHLTITMTSLLQNALDVADEESFVGSYDDELGYVKSFFYSPGPPEAPGGYGFDVPCFEASLADDACTTLFRPEPIEP